jgi:hypothetical protein
MAISALLVFSLRDFRANLRLHVDIGPHLARNEQPSACFLQQPRQVSCVSGIAGPMELWQRDPEELLGCAPR